MARASLLLLLLPALLAISVRGDKTKEEEVSFTTFIENMQQKFENATRVFNNATGLSLPATQDEMQHVVQDAIKTVKDSGQKIQTKLAEYNVTDTSLSALLTNIQAQVAATMDNLKKQASPEVQQNIDQMVTQARTGYDNLVTVTKNLHEAVSKNADKTSQDLQPTLEEIKNHLAEAANVVQAKFQEAIADKKKT